MTNANWYNVGNRDEFLAKGIPQETITAELDGIGQEDIVFLSGFSFSVIFKGEVLTPFLNGRNPYYRNKAGCMIDDNGDVWCGYASDL
jgi:hypothetical protein